ncbi:MAG TPA: hypothetical protein VFC78_02385 [Tepidisphaeraceae bacterium]|nr:hypothetical protein [Tepidisphaeraceae bacterium]
MPVWDDSSASFAAGPCGPVMAAARLGEPRAESSNDYRRAARRLRGMHADDPARLHRGLRELSRRHDQTYRAGPPARDTNPDSLIPLRVWRAEEFSADSAKSVRHRRAGADAAFAPAPDSRATVDWFADHVAGALEGRILRYSRRVALLKTAGRLGIGRFDANLIIAATQHQQTDSDKSVCDAVGKPKRVRLAHILLLLAVQIVIAYGAWWVWRGA